jgi:hypothetical protein
MSHGGLPGRSLPNGLVGSACGLVTEGGRATVVTDVAAGCLRFACLCLGGLCFACRKGVERALALDFDLDSMAVGEVGLAVAVAVQAVAVAVAEALGSVVGALGTKSR